MKIAFPLLAFFAFLFTGTLEASSVENTTEAIQQRWTEIRDLEQKQAQNPFDADLHFILGNNYWTLNEDQKAIEHYQRALLLEPDYHSVHWNLSAIYNRREDGKNAIFHMKKAEEIYSKKEDLKSLAGARKRLRDYFEKYEYEPEEFEPRKGFFWRIFN